MSDTAKKTEAYSPGLEGVLAGETALCEIDEARCGLRYRGYAIEDLANQALFEEVAHLLLLGTLPTRKQLEDFSAQLRQRWPLPGPVEAFLGVIAPDAHPMDILRTGVSLLGMADREAPEGGLHEANVRKAVRLLAQIPVLISSAYRRLRGKSTLQPRADLTFAENLLYLLTERQGDETARAMARALNASLILYAEHEFNASTFAARVAASTLTDLHAAVTAAIAALKGPLHGGANEAVAAMLVEIGSPERAEGWIRGALSRHERVMGFGHRVIKTEDVRSRIVRGHAERLCRLTGEMRWYEIATILAKVMLAEKSLHPNLDFYTAVAYLVMDLPPEVYTPMFVCSRITGWCAHIIEQQDHNRLIRPRALYTGPPPQPYVPLDERA
jgi:2-methylcitrate synthase